jgi:hypothetical protein
MRGMDELDMCRAFSPWAITVALEPRALPWAGMGPAVGRYEGQPPVPIGIGIANSDPDLENERIPY